MKRRSFYLCTKGSVLVQAKLPREAKIVANKKFKYKKVSCKFAHWKR